MKDVIYIYIYIYIYIILLLTSFEGNSKSLRCKKLHLNTRYFSFFLYSNLLTWLNLNSFLVWRMILFLTPKRKTRYISFSYISEIYLLCKRVYVCILYWKSIQKSRGIQTHTLKYKLPTKGITKLPWIEEAEYLNIS